jgi:hypothetical protein
LKRRRKPTITRLDKTIARVRTSASLRRKSPRVHDSGGDDRVAFGRLVVIADLFMVKMSVDPVLFPEGVARCCVFMETNAGIASRASPATAHTAICKTSLLLLPTLTKPTSPLFDLLY